MTRLWNWSAPAGRSLRSVADLLVLSRGWASRAWTLLLPIACVIVCLPANSLQERAGRQTEEAKEDSSSIGIPRFELPQSGLEWRSVAQPQKYFDATGHRAAILGKQDGRFEVWIYPIKVLHGFHLEFQQDGMIEPARGEDYLQEVVTRPESTTLVYAHPLFTVREIVWVPHDEPSAVVFFDVESNKPITITARFTPDFKPMWPASLGGQYSFWIPEDRAFGLTDGTSVPTAMIGSPTVSEYTDFVDNGLISGEMELKLRATAEQAHAALIPLVMALSMDSPEKAREIYRAVASHAQELYTERVSYPRDFLARTMHIETPDAELNRAFTWSKAAIEAGWVCNNTYGCGLVAGYGPSGSSERPGFDWWFGGDALMSSWAMEDYGDLAGALQALRFLKGRQRDDGKMMHEMTQSAGLVDWFGKYHYAYYHADTTPFYIYSIEQYWTRTGDRKFLDEFWESAKKAYAYCLTTVDPADQLMDNTKAGLAAVEWGVLRGKVVKDMYLEGAWLAGLEAMERLAKAAGDEQIASDTITRLARTRESIEKQWWNSEGKFFAFGRTADGRRDDMVTDWSAVALALTSQVGGEEAEGDVAKLASPELATDWAERLFSNKSAYYDSVSYNNGTAWPFMHAFVGWAEYAHGNPVAGFATWTNGARLTGMQAPGYMPEHMNGDRYLAGERSVPHQLFSSVGVIVPAVRGLLGLETSQTGSSGNGEARVVRFRPQLPADWSFVRFSGYVAGADRLSGEVRQGVAETIVRLHAEGSETLTADITVPVPLLAKIRSVTLNGKSAKFKTVLVGGTNGVEVQVALFRDEELTVEHDAGIGIVPPKAGAGLGDRNASLKVMRIRVADQNTIEFLLAGSAGRSNTLDLITALPTLTANGAEVKKTEHGYRVTIPFNDSEYASRVIRVSTGPN